MLDDKGIDCGGFHVEPAVDQVEPATPEGSWTITSIAISHEGRTRRYTPPARRFLTRRQAIGYAYGMASGMIDSGGVKV